MVALSSYPGGDLIAAGLSDLENGRVTVESLLVSVGVYRLRDSGIDVANPIPGAERRLYDLLADENADAAHGRYNALIRRLVSFERALECARP